jgi:hypothetical protein
VAISAGRWGVVVTLLLNQIAAERIVSKTAAALKIRHRGAGVLLV